MKRLVVASTNAGKVREIQAALASLGEWFLEPFSNSVGGFEETCFTFLENAVQKAKHFSCMVDSLTLADDSGLMVDALDGRPGVQSARYAPTHEARNQRLLEELQGIPDDRRGARFVCALALARSGTVLWTVEASVEGRVTHAPAGTHGFGYDPIFWLPDRECTMSQIPLMEKNRISHRGRAVTRLKESLEAMR